MQIIVNGETHTTDGEITIAELLARLNLTPGRVAVEVNEELVRRTEFGQRRLEEGDRVEIVTLVGGG
jgi:sulfur carrier protein